MEQNNNDISRDDNANAEPSERIRLHQAVYVQIWERLSEKSEAYDATDIVSSFPPLHHFSPHAVWLGAFSRSVPSQRWRLFLGSAVETYKEEVATPPQIARAYLDIKYPKQLRARGSQLEFWKPRRSQPMYTLPGKYREEHVYVDIASAYWTILKVIGWDVDYFPGMLVRRSSVNDFPYPENRLARNSLVSLGLPGKGALYKDGKIILIPHSWKVNIGLWSAVQDVLNGIADDMVKRAGAVYVNTDGYIIPSSSMDVALGIADEWGLPLRTKFQGRTTIYGVGAYSIGAHICKRNMRLSPVVDAINPHHKERLRRYMRFLSDHPG